MTKREAAAHIQGLAIGSAFGFFIGMRVGMMGGVMLLFVGILLLYGAYRLEKPLEQ